MHLKQEDRLHAMLRVIENTPLRDASYTRDIIDTCTVPVVSCPKQGDSKLEFYRSLRSGASAGEDRMVIYEREDVVEGIRGDLKHLDEVVPLRVDFCILEGEVKVSSFWELDAVIEIAGGEDCGEYVDVKINLASVVLRRYTCRSRVRYVTHGISGLCVRRDAVETQMSVECRTVCICHEITR